MDERNPLGKKAFFSRKTMPKTRIGCHICKSRRVKCDETKPECLRCLKFGVGKCAYQSPPYERKVPIIILPTRRTTLRPLKPLYQLHSGPVFNDDEEYRCYNLFTTDGLVHFAGAFSDTLWGRIMAQASESEPFVRECFVAIGALERAAALPQDCPPIKVRGRPKKSPPNKSYAYALMQYGKALRTMRMALSKDPQNLRLVLIACLLVFGFESYVGHQVSAVTHAQSGIAVLRQWETQLQSESPGVHSPAPYVVEDELIQAFTRMDLQVSMLLDTRELDFHVRVKNETCEVLEKMPSTFTTTDEARIWCELLMRWNSHFRTESMIVGKTNEIPIKDTPMKWEDSINAPMGANALHEPKKIPISLLPEYRAHLAKTQQWFSAFEPLFKTLRPENAKDFATGITLQVQCKTSAILLGSAFFSNEMGFDDFLTEFRDIVSLTTLLIPISGHPKKRFLYHFDSGSIPGLFVVATKCRDRALRREAIRLLFLVPRREGVFDSICMAHMAEWLMKLEQEGLDVDEQIPDYRRVRSRRRNVDLPMRRAHLSVTQRRTPDDLEPEWKEVILSW